MQPAHPGQHAAQVSDLAGVLCVVAGVDDQRLPGGPGRTAREEARERSRQLLLRGRPNAPARGLVGGLRVTEQQVPFRTERGDLLWGVAVAMALLGQAEAPGPAVADPDLGLTRDA